MKKTKTSLQRVKGLRCCNVMHKNAAVRAPVESDAERLKPLLTCGVPDLHRHRLPVDHHIFCKEVGADGGLGRMMMMMMLK